MPQLNSLVWVFILAVRWAQAQLVHPLVEWWMDTVLGTWEETLKSLLREGFNHLTRTVNGFFAWLVALLLDRSYLRRVRRSGKATSAWRAWARAPRPSTFNALIAREQTHSSVSNGANPGISTWSGKLCSWYGCEDVGCKLGILCHKDTT